STATICSIEKRLRFMANHLLVQGQVCRKTRSRIGPGFLTQISGQIQQTDLVADDVFTGVTPWRLHAILMKIRTSTKTDNPTSW
ncbi:hypothetical protein, partial [Burkholderia gladioli]|uniref:hypothetical protein n=1 Tax=Burkholderia gladioli TaxID=28095 RepID=UPI001ABB7E32